MTLQNFKGVESLSLAPMGKDMEILGENGTGKTTVADAYAWVVFGKGFSGETVEQEIKRRDSETGLTPNDGGVIHAVEAELLLDGGITLTLRKEYVETWQKKRGAAESEFRGHTTNYSIDGVPMQKKEYEKRVAEVIPEAAGRLLSIPLHFCDNLKWQERRKILMDMCGEVSDAEVLVAEEFSPLEKLMEGKSVDDFRKTVKAKMKKVNDELKGIPARIDELKKMDAEAVGKMTKDELSEELEALQKKRAEAEAKIAKLENGGEAAELKKELAEVEAEMTHFKASVEAEYTRKAGEAESIIRGCEAEIERRGAEMVALQDKATQLETINATTDKMAQDLRDTWAAENAKQPDIEISDVCPCCGQALPAEKIEEARAKAIEDFNLKKAKTLSDITAKGKRMMEQKAKNVEEINAGRKKLAVLNKRVSELADKKAEAEKLLAEDAKPDVTQETEYKRLEEYKAAIQERIDALAKGNNTDAIENVKKTIAAIDEDIAEDNEKLAAIVQAESVKKREAELKAREKELGAIYSDLEKSLDLAERFVVAKVKATEEAINSHFKYVRFTMFRPQINGGLEECCEPTINGVPVGAGLNTGAEMKAALDILNALSAHYGLNLPVFIDNCESYTSASLIPIDNQLIRLVVSEGQKNLKVEIEGEGEQEFEAVKPTAKDSGRAAA